ncbi:MAG: hypothetical protein FWE90_11240 [Defluviitaleaceae bacterium]|nr:hypothetical protein [Defluviitaleaceae bacterium]
MQDKLMIMNFNNECVGYVQRTKDVFIQNLNGEVTEHRILPPILCGIAPEQTQFPAANDVLEYYGMTRMDVWMYLARSNGLKSSRDVWFMAEPVGEVWIPLIRGMQSKNGYAALFKPGDKVEVLMNGKAYINRHTIDIFPPSIKPYLKREEGTRFSTVKGYVKDLSDLSATRGLIGRIVLDFIE